MKVLAFVHLYVPMHNAGGETTLHDLLRAMVKEGWDVEVVLSRPTPEYSDYEVDGVKVFVHTEKRQIIRHLLTADLLITHLENSERAGILGKKYRVPTVHLIHNNMPITKGYLGLGCDLAVFNTQWVSDDFTEYKGKRLVLHPRVDISKFSDYKSDGKESGYITLVNLWGGKGKRGREGKGPEIFYEMASRFPDQKFLGVVGGYGEQDIRELPNVTILPHTPNIGEDVYSKTRILLMPSRYESYGRVAVEGAAAGIPTIASPTPGLKEALGPEALYANPDDPDAWEECIKTLLDGRKYRKYSRLYQERVSTFPELQEQELELFLSTAHELAYTGKLLRGW